jgi:hypothetical protein
MSKNSWKSRLEQTLFVLIVMVGAFASAALDVRAVAAAMAAGKHGLAAPAATSPASAVTGAALVAALAH